MMEFQFLDMIISKYIIYPNLSWKCNLQNDLKKQIAKTYHFDTASNRTLQARTVENFPSCADLTTDAY